MSDDLAQEREKTLLSLLGQLNDSELIILGWYGTNMVGEQADNHYARHEDIVTLPVLEGGMSDWEVLMPTPARSSILPGWISMGSSWKAWPLLADPEVRSERARSPAD